MTLYLAPYSRGGALLLHTKSPCSARDVNFPTGYRPDYQCLVPHSPRGGFYSYAGFPSFFFICTPFHCPICPAFPLQCRWLPSSQIDAPSRSPRCCPPTAPRYSPPPHAPYSATSSTTPRQPRGCEAVLQPDTYWVACRALSACWLPFELACLLVCLTQYSGKTGVLRQTIQARQTETYACSLGPVPWPCPWPSASPCSLDSDPSADLRSLWPFGAQCSLSGALLPVLAACFPCSWCSWSGARSLFSVCVVLADFRSRAPSPLRSDLPLSLSPPCMRGQH